jgi:peptidoglycan hydrolase CwlO-like protein
MKKIILATLLVLSFTAGLAVSHYGSYQVWAQTEEEQSEEDNSEKIEELEDQIEEYEDKIKDLRSEANTLNNEIESFNAQINVTQLKISNSIEKIRRTEREIDDLTGDIGQMIERIDQMAERIDYQEEILNERIRERYKTRETSPIIVLLGSNTLNDLVKKAAYLKVMEVQDNKVLSQMRDTKDVYNRQKKLYEEEKEKEEELQEQLIVEKANLDAYKRDLESKKAEKARLLEATQNDEQKYQDLLAEAKAELNSYSSFVESTGQGVIGPNGLGGGKDGWYYSQRDSRWAYDKIGDSPYNVYQAGCLVTSVAMVHTYYGYDVDPADIADKDELFIYGSMWIPWPGPGGRSYKLLGWGYPESKIDDELDDDNPVIVGITANNAAGTHFVVLYEGDNGDYKMNDPIYGPDLDFDDYYSTGQIFEAVVFD